jgi:predicted DNA-binding protein with PD1-like motif
VGREDGQVRFNEAQGVLGKVVVARLGSGTDVIEAIEKICEDNHIGSAIIATAIGSLAQAEFSFIIPKEDTKLKAGKGEPLFLEGPLDLLGAQGTVGWDQQGNRYTHLHGMLADKLDRLYGGHLVKGKNPVLLTMEISLIELKGISLIRRFYEETGSYQLSPEKCEE